MAGVIAERTTSRPFTLSGQSVRTLKYIVTGTDDEDEVLTLLEGAAPASYEGLILDSLEAEPREGDQSWECSARYVGGVDESEFTFDTGGGNNRITQSITTIASYAAVGTPPDFEGAIGVSTDRVEGVDVPAPAFNFTETHSVDDSVILSGYKITVRDLTGTVNDDTFKGHAAGECLLLGVTGTKRGSEKWRLTYRFAASKNATGLTVGSITGIDKDGWDYLWVRYADFTDMGAFSLVQRPSAVYVERVLPRADFSLLGIGT